MARPTIAALQAELAALRHNYEVLATERDSAIAERDTLRTEFAALRAAYAAIPVAAARPTPSAPSTARRTASITAFEFDPSIRGDFMRATKLAREANGIVRRARS